MVKVTTSILIDTTLRAKAQEKGIKLGYLLERGWQSIHNDTANSERIREAEDAIIKLQGHLTTMSTKYYDLKESIERNAGKE